MTGKVFGRLGSSEIEQEIRPIDAYGGRWRIVGRAFNPFLNKEAKMK